MINNQTSRFILPLVCEKTPKFYLREDFIGAYIGDVNKPEYDGNLLLVYRYPWTTEFAKFELELMKHKNFITSYDYEDKSLTIYVFEIDSYSETTSAMLLGAYSEIPAEDKLTISKFWFNFSGSELTKEVMNNEGYMVNTYWIRSLRNKEDYCKEGECWYVPNLDEEILDHSKMI